MKSVDYRQVLLSFRWTLEFSDTQWLDVREHWVNLENVERFEASLSPPLQGSGPVWVHLAPPRDPESAPIHDLSKLRTIKAEYRRFGGGGQLNLINLLRNREWSDWVAEKDLVYLTSARDMPSWRRLDAAYNLYTVCVEPDPCTICGLAANEGVIWTCEDCQASVHAQCTGIDPEPELYHCWKCLGQLKPVPPARQMPQRSERSQLPQSSVQSQLSLQSQRPIGKTMLLQRLPLGGHPLPLKRPLGSPLHVQRPGGNPLQIQRRGNRQAQSGSQKLNGSQMQGGSQGQGISHHQQQQQQQQQQLPLLAAQGALSQQLPQQQGSIQLPLQQQGFLPLQQRRGTHRMTASLETEAGGEGARPMKGLMHRLGSRSQRQQQDMQEIHQSMHEDMQQPQDRMQRQEGMQHGTAPLKDSEATATASEVAEAAEVASPSKQARQERDADSDQPGQGPRVRSMGHNAHGCAGGGGHDVTGAGANGMIEAGGVQGVQQQRVAGAGGVSGQGAVLNPGPLLSRKHQAGIAVQACVVASQSTSVSVCGAVPMHAPDDQHLHGQDVEQYGRDLRGHGQQDGPQGAASLQPAKRRLLLLGEECEVHDAAAAAAADSNGLCNGESAAQQHEAGRLGVSGLFAEIMQGEASRSVSSDGSLGGGAGHGAVADALEGDGAEHYEPLLQQQQPSQHQHGRNEVLHSSITRSGQGGAGSRQLRRAEHGAEGTSEPQSSGLQNLRTTASGAQQPLALDTAHAASAGMSGSLEVHADADADADGMSPDSMVGGVVVVHAPGVYRPQQQAPQQAHNLPSAGDQTAVATPPPGSSLLNTATTSSLVKEAIAAQTPNTATGYGHSTGAGIGSGPGSGSQKAGNCATAAVAADGAAGASFGGLVGGLGASNVGASCGVGSNVATFGLEAASASGLVAGGGGGSAVGLRVTSPVGKAMAAANVMPRPQQLSQQQRSSTEGGTAAAAAAAASAAAAGGHGHELGAPQVTDAGASGSNGMQQLRAGMPLGPDAATAMAASAAAAAAAAVAAAAAAEHAGADAAGTDTSAGAAPGQAAAAGTGRVTRGSARQLSKAAAAKLAAAGKAASAATETAGNKPGIRGRPRTVKLADGTPTTKAAADPGVTSEGATPGGLISLTSSVSQVHAAEAEAAKALGMLGISGRPMGQLGDAAEAAAAPRTGTGGRGRGGGSPGRGGRGRGQGEKGRGSAGAAAAGGSGGGGGGGGDLGAEETRRVRRRGAGNRGQQQRGPGRRRGRARAGSITSSSSEERTGSDSESEFVASGSEERSHSRSRSRSREGVRGRGRASARMVGKGRSSRSRSRERDERRRRRRREERSRDLNPLVGARDARPALAAAAPHLEVGGGQGGRVPIIPAAMYDLVVRMLAEKDVSLQESEHETQRLQAALGLSYRRNEMLEGQLASCRAELATLQADVARLRANNAVLVNARSAQHAIQSMMTERVRQVCEANERLRVTISGMEQQQHQAAAAAAAARGGGGSGHGGEGHSVGVGVGVGVAGGGGGGGASMHHGQGQGPPRHLPSHTAHHHQQHYQQQQSHWQPPGQVHAHDHGQRGAGTHAHASNSGHPHPHALGTAMPPDHHHVVGGNGHAAVSAAPALSAPALSALALSAPAMSESDTLQLPLGDGHAFQAMDGPCVSQAAVHILDQQMLLEAEELQKQIMEDTPAVGDCAGVDFNVRSSSSGMVAVPRGQQQAAAAAETGRAAEQSQGGSGRAAAAGLAANESMPARERGAVESSAVGGGVGGGGSDGDVSGGHCCRGHVFHGRHAVAAKPAESEGELITPKLAHGEGRTHSRGTQGPSQTHGSISGGVPKGSKYELKQQQ